MRSLSEPTLYFITRDNHVEHIDSIINDISFKNVQADEYEKKCVIDRETWKYIDWWTSWHY